jgi:hypothetical protein
MTHICLQLSVGKRWVSPTHYVSAIVWLFNVKLSVGKRLYGHKLSVGVCLLTEKLSAKNSRLYKCRCSMKGIIVQVSVKEYPCV